MTGMTNNALERRVSASPLNRQVAENISAMLFRAGMTQNQLAELAGMTSPTMSRKMLQKNDWSLVEVGRIAEVLELELGELVGTLPSFDEWRARRDSNPKPSDLEPRPVLALVSGGGEGVKPGLTLNRRPLLVVGDELEAVV